MQAYLTNKIVSLPQDKRNSTRSFKQWVDIRNPGQGKYINKTYYPYGADVSDFGWGCAWRCLQMILSNNKITFEELFKQFGSKESLLAVYEELYPDSPTLQVLKDQAKWAPYDVKMNKA